jgi:RNA polymerase sigma-70 factor (ECF subfamily)
MSSAEDEALDRLGGDEVQALLGALTSDQRDVLLLRIVADLSLEETATVVGKRVGAVKALQRRGLEALRREIHAQGVSR